jgi:multidrug efflux pump subunit AcrB
VANLGNVQAISPLSTSTVPLDQVISGTTIEWENPIIARRDRRRTVTVQASPANNSTLPDVMATVQAQFEAIPLPVGYSMDWGGEYEDTVDSQEALLPGVIPAVAIIVLVIVLLFNDLRPLAVILGVIPFMFIGITLGLLVFDTPFGFVALLGAMSLAGMMIKNAIVLLDAINTNLADGLSSYDAVVEAAISRLRPVLLAAATTILGVIPLLGDIFWVGMAVVIMAGLAFGSILTMVLVPVLYSIIYKVHPGDRTAPSATMTHSAMEPALR